MIIQDMTLIKRRVIDSCYMYIVAFDHYGLIHIYENGFIR